MSKFTLGRVIQVQSPDSRRRGDWATAYGVCASAGGGGDGGRVNRQGLQAGAGSAGLVAELQRGWTVCIL